MGNNTRSSALSALSTIKGFKHFLGKYHERLHQDLNFPQLGRGKALQAAARTLGFSAWQAVLSAGDATSGEQGLWSLVHYEVDLEDRASGGDFVGPLVLRSARACLDYLVDTAKQIEGWADFIEIPDDIMSMAAPRGMKPVDDGQMPYDWTDVFDVLTLAEQLRVIEWYYGAVNDESTAAGYRIQYIAPGEEGSGTSVTLADVASAIVKC